MTKPRVGFIGLGVMGLPMSRHILNAGYPLTVFNRTASKCRELASAGAGVADTCAELARASEVIFTMVSDSPDVEQVIAGPAGVLEGIQPGSVVVDMSTISPAVEQRLDEALRARNCYLLDAPVSGGDVGARNATLAIMIGGDPGQLERVRPILEVMGKRITHCGKVGSGQLTKQCNQILVSLTLLGVCECLGFASNSGLDPGMVIKAVAEGAAGSWQLSNLGPKIVSRDFAPGFMIDLILKDLRLVLENAASVQTPVPGIALVNQLFRSAQAKGYGRLGTQALAQVLESLTK